MKSPCLRCEQKIPTGIPGLCSVLASDELPLGAPAGAAAQRVGGSTVHLALGDGEQLDTQMILDSVDIIYIFIYKELIDV